MVLGGVGWDKKEFSEPNLNVYGRDDTKIVVYNLGRCTKKGGSEKKSSSFYDKTENSCNFVKERIQYKISSSGHFEDGLSHLTYV